jgi:hypothetical protein
VQAIRTKKGLPPRAVMNMGQLTLLIVALLRSPLEVPPPRCQVSARGSLFGVEGGGLGLLPGALRGAAVVRHAASSAAGSSRRDVRSCRYDGYVREQECRAEQANRRVPVAESRARQLQPCVRPVGEGEGHEGGAIAPAASEEQREGEEEMAGRRVGGWRSAKRVGSGVGVGALRNAQGRGELC